ncbi:MAG: sulfotransferase [Proteobacteria bacterium]|nr:sulfotransferase [Pseudomonadota bacterium]
MKLQVPFIQLPVQFDADLLAGEVAAFGESAWRPHPQRFEGNDFLPLIAAAGEPENEAFDKPMRPTKYLRSSPYLTDVLTTLGCSLGRTRLMRLSPGADVTPHVDVHYYWRDRMRIHVPIVTQPTVTFHCGAAAVHMKAGECWIFDTWRVHRVTNEAPQSRVHLVVDTVGGDGFWRLAMNGRAPGGPDQDGWAARPVAPFGSAVDKLGFESTNYPRVMTPWEVREHTQFLLAELDEQTPAPMELQRAIAEFTHVWRALWSTYGETGQGQAQYEHALSTFADELNRTGARRLFLRNGSNLVTALQHYILDVALSDRRADSVGEVRVAPERRQNGGQPAAAALTFDRPVFVVCPPRSGSTLLFETLAQAPSLYTIGGESHHTIEEIPALSVPAHNWDSNRLTAEDATPDVIRALRTSFEVQLRDRDGGRPNGGAVRMLEKTPKNSLRVPFLAECFPDAHFVFLYRDVREVLASMLEAWESGHFRTYPRLPGWTGRHPWSLLLTPGWRDLRDLPLNEIVAAQWGASVRVLLDDLAHIPAERRDIVRYEDLLADPDAEMRRLCGRLGLSWDRTLGKELPLSSYTVSAPKAEKWRARADEIEAVLPNLAGLVERMASFAAQP